MVQGKQNKNEIEQEGEKSEKSADTCHQVPKQVTDSRLK